MDLRHLHPAPRHDPDADGGAGRLRLAGLQPDGRRRLPRGRVPDRHGPDRPRRRQSRGHGPGRDRRDRGADQDDRRDSPAHLGQHGGVLDGHRRVRAGQGDRRRGAGGAREGRAGAPVPAGRHRGADRREVRHRRLPLHVARRLRERPLRRAVVLRREGAEGAAAVDQGGRERRGRRAAQARDPGLARSAEARGARPDGARRGARDPDEARRAAGRPDRDAGDRILGQSRGRIRLGRGAAPARRRRARRDDHHARRRRPGGRRLRGPARDRPLLRQPDRRPGGPEAAQVEPGRGRRPGQGAARGDQAAPATRDLDRDRLRRVRPRSRSRSRGSRPTS